MSNPHDDGMSRNNSSQAMLSLFSAYNDQAEDPAPGDTATADTATADTTTADTASEDAEDAADTGPTADRPFDDPFSGSEDEQDTDSKKASPEQSDTDGDQPTVKKLKIEKKVMKLVSYGAMDEGDDDEEEEAGTLELEEQHVVTELSVLSTPVERAPCDDNATTNADPIVQGSRVEGEDLLPPQPPGKCSRHLQDKVSRMYEKMQHQRLNLNRSIQSKKEFRNPSIYEKLIQVCGIDEKGTNYPPELFDPSIWGADSYYTELAKLQKEEMDKREKEKKDKTKIDFVTGVKKDSLGKPGERKSKWDTQGGLRVAEVVSQSVTTTASGNKTTVISAVGTLKKNKS